MVLSDVFKKILSGKALLLTGSGANVGVCNHNGKQFPLGTSLAKELYRKSGNNNPSDEGDLQDASELFMERFSGDDLIAYLKDTLNVGWMSHEINYIHNLPWIRRYTTNYDDVPVCATESRIIPVTLNYNTKKYLDDKNVCVYINGYIGNLSNETLMSEFKLTGKSYISADNILNSQWGSVLKNDIQIAEVIVIIGMSLNYDLDLKRIICNEADKSKVVFIDYSGLHPDDMRKMQRIGEVYNCGLDNFAREIEEFAKSYEAEKEPQKLYCFEKDNGRRVYNKARAVEVYDMFMSGHITNSLFYKEKGIYDNLIYRTQVNDVIKAINTDKRCVFIHANLGNGKTFFLEMIKQQLYSKGVAVYTFIDQYNQKLVKDIDLITKNNDKKVIIIENYFNHIDIIKTFSLHECQGITFLLSARTMIYDTKLPNVCEALGIEQGDSVVVDINRLNESEIRNCCTIMDNNGFWGEKANLSKKDKLRMLRNKKAGNCELNTILLMILNSPDINERLQVLIEKVKNTSGKYYECLLIMLVSKVMALELNMDDINSMIGISCLVDPVYMSNEAIMEFTTLDENGKLDYKIKSSVVSRAVLQSLKISNDIIDSLITIAKYANNYSKNSRYEGVLQNIVSASHVNTLVRGKNDNIDFIMTYYDSLKGLSYYKDNSFFWLQYSIACTKYGKYALAQRYLDNAYAKYQATGISIPFQCDNQQARLYLEQIMNDPDVDIKMAFEKAHNLIMKPIVSDRDREELTMRLLFYYSNEKFIKKIMKKGLEKEFHVYCGEGYNRLQQFLRNIRNERDRERYMDLSKKLMSLSIHK